MSKLQNNHVFTSESVSEGHPDKVADAVCRIFCGLGVPDYWGPEDGD